MGLIMLWASRSERTEDTARATQVLHVLDRCGNVAGPTRDYLRALWAPMADELGWPIELADPGERVWVRTRG